MKRIYCISILLSFFCMCTSAAGHDGYVLKENISYVSEETSDDYRLSRCRLDLYYPDGAEDYPTVLWIHGGSLTSKSKEIPDEFRDQGIAVAAVNYRLYPKASSPSYIYDVAEALAWVFSHIEEYGGNADKVYVAGHSAGGYLTLMLALDKKYAARFGFDNDRVVKYYPISAQTATHYTVRKERGLDKEIPVVDSLAPLNCVRKDGSPIMLITGDRNMEMFARYEENAYLDAVLRHFGHPVELYELQGFNHGGVKSPACILIRKDIKATEKNRAEPVLSGQKSF